MNCKHCGSIVPDNFCGHCGQSIKVGPITFGSLLNELSENVFQVNKGFFFTLKEMFVRPGQSIRDYLSGKRKKHFKPIGYALILSTFYFLLTQITAQPTWLENFFSGINFKIGPEEEAYMPPAITWASKNYAYVTLLLIPVYALATKIAFAKEEKNYIEHIIANSYISGQQALFYSLFTMLTYCFGNHFIRLLPLIFVIGFNYFSLNQLFNQTSWKKNFIRTILSYLLYIILFLCLAFVVLFIGAVN